MDPDRQRWLLVIISTARASSTLRTHVWRKLRSMGALYLQQSVCLLPDQPETARLVARLLDRVRRESGEGRALHIRVDDPAEEADLIEAFRAERSDEYAEICSRTPDFLKEIETERARGRATYTEVEESEADLERFRTWFAKVRTRDYFGAPGASEAEEAIQRCAAALADFEAEAMAADVAEASAGSGRAHPLRVVGKP